MEQNKSNYEIVWLVDLQQDNGAKNWQLLPADISEELERQHVNYYGEFKITLNSKRYRVNLLIRKLIDEDNNTYNIKRYKSCDEKTKIQNGSSIVEGSGIFSNGTFIVNEPYDYNGYNYGTVISTTFGSGIDR
jgi:hypothetical protein